MPTSLRTASAFCISADGRNRARRVKKWPGGPADADLVVEAASGEQVFSVSLLWHPYDGHLYALDSLAHRINHWQRWNPETSQWESCGEGSIFFVHAARALLPLLFIVFLLASILCLFARLRPWLAGVVLPLGSICLVFGALNSVPIAWQVSSIYAAAFSPDGLILATASQHGTDSAICLWDAATGKGMAKMDLFDAYGDSIAFSPDGKKLTLRCAGDVTRVWDLDNNLGVVMAGHGQVDAAAAYQRAMAGKPECAEDHYNLGVALASRGQVDAAVDHFRKALAIKPDYAEAHYQLGLALAEKGRRAEAIAEYKKALAIKPDYEEARQHLNDATEMKDQGH